MDVNNKIPAEIPGYSTRVVEFSSLPIGGRFFAHDEQGRVIIVQKTAGGCCWHPMAGRAFVMDKYVRVHAC